MGSACSRRRGEDEHDEARPEVEEDAMVPLEEDKFVAAAAEPVLSQISPPESPLSIAGSPVPSWGRSVLRSRWLARTASSELTELPTQ